MKPTRVTHIITNLGLGGAERTLLELVCASEGVCLNNSVISLQAGGMLANAFRAARVPLLELGLQKRLLNPLKAFELIRAIEYTQPDIVQTWMYHADFLGGAAAKIAKCIPVVWNVRNLTFDQQNPNRLTQTLVRLNAAISGLIPNKIITNSYAAELEHVRLGYAQEKMHVIPNGFNLAKYMPNKNSRRIVRRELGLDDDILLVGLFARFDPLKDHATFAKAAGELAREYTRARFVLAGVGITSNNVQLNSMIKASGVSSRFNLLGPRDDVPNLINSLDILVSSSVSESFPNVVGEAMASGIPCVVTDVGDSRYLVGNAGIVIPPASASALAQACAQLLGLNHEERVQIGLAGRQRIRSEFTLQAMVERYSAVYECVASKKI